jgi:type IV pilus assembly protein PilV
MHQHHPNPHPARAQRGFALLEVLIAVVVLAIGLLGMAALQSSALRNNQSSLERTQAVVLSYSILDAMRANVAVARNNGYNIGKTCAVPTATASLKDYNLKDWIGDIQTALNDTAACGQIACANDVCTITVTWNDSRGGLNQVVDATDATKTLTTVGRL